MEDICNFIPPKSDKSSIEYFHFVYETNYKKLRQPFIHSNYYMHLVFKGNGHLTVNGRSFPLEKGTLFFTFPDNSFELNGSDDFTFLYISFNGSGVEGLLKDFKIDREAFVCYGFEQLLEFWMAFIRRINRINANPLTESVFMYTLSFVNNSPEKTADKFDSIIEYIDNNCTDCDISIKKLRIFSFTVKNIFLLFLQGK